jgi:hypothetical protein
VAPAVPLAQPGEALPSIVPGDVIDELNPGAVPLGQYFLNRPRAGVTEQNLVGVLQSI